MINSTRAYAKLVAAFNQNDWLRVQQRATQLLPLAPADAGVHFMLGVALLQTRQLVQALSALLKATQLEPQRVDCAVEYAKALAFAQRLREARFAADRAMTLAPSDPFTLDALGMIYTQVRATLPSATAFRRAVELMPEQAAFRFNLAFALSLLGDVDGAAHELEACIRLDPCHWQAHLQLAKLQHRATADDHIARLQALLAEHDKDNVARIYLNIALGEEYESKAQYPAAFNHYVNGNAAVRRVRPYAIEHDEAMFKALMHDSPAAAVDTVINETADVPVFIVGMPHTGTVLLERILASHPDVQAASELSNFPALIQQACKVPAPLHQPDMAARLQHVDWRQLGKAYLRSAQQARANKPYFIDKLSYNFLYAGLIARALPNARILCLRRDPLDTCLGNFRHLFEQESAHFDYSYDLLDSGRYYIQFDRLMAHWQRFLPGRILEISCESLVQTPQTSLRQVLAFCGLPWADACLRAADNAGSGQHTPIGHWRHYAPQLRALRELLAGAGIPLQD